MYLSTIDLRHLVTDRNTSCAFSTLTLEAIKGLKPLPKALLPPAANTTDSFRNKFLHMTPDPNMNRNHGSKSQTGSPTKYVWLVVGPPYDPV